MVIGNFARAGACAVVLALASVGVAEARVVAGANFGISQFDYEDIDDGTATMFYLGYELAESPAYFELALIDTGEADVTSLSDVTIEVSGLQVGVGYRLIANPDTGSDLFMKAGLYNTDTEAVGPGGSVEDGNTGLYLGFGGTLMLAPSFGLRFDMQGLLGVEDFADDNNVTLIMLGPVFKFGASEH
jgi:hypothetical protein